MSLQGLIVQFSKYTELAKKNYNFLHHTIQNWIHQQQSNPQIIQT